jgi:hypothetical protein
MLEFVLMLQVIENHSLSIVTEAFKRCKDSYFWGKLLNIYLHNSILHHILISVKLFFQLSNKIFLKYFENILG